jgi:hypothetical protein
VKPFARRTAAVVAILLCVALSACAVKRDDAYFVGIWQANDGATVTIKADHSFVSDNMPCEVVALQFYENQTYSGAGTWQRADEESIRLHYSSLTSTSNSITVPPYPALTLIADRSQSSTAYFLKPDADRDYYDLTKR